MNGQSNESEIRERDETGSREQGNPMDQRESPMGSTSTATTENITIDRGANPFPEDIVPGTGGNTGGRGNDI